MSTEEFIIGFFIRVDEQMAAVAKHPQASLYPSELVTLALLFALKGVGERPFYRWLRRDCLPLFPKLPERTRLFRLFVTHQDWTDRFLAAPTVLGVADSYGIEFIHPWREGRTPDQIGKKGVSNRRWIVGGKLAFVLNSVGRGQCMGVRHRQCSRPDLPAARRAVRGGDDRADRQRFSRRRGRSGEHESLPQRGVERADDGRDSPVDADGGLSLHAPAASGMAVLSGASGGGDGGLQSLGAVAWTQTGQGGTHPPFHR